MKACLRTLPALILAGVLTACSQTPTSPLGDLPLMPQASLEQQLQRAQSAKPEAANLLRLSAADQALQQGNASLAEQILDLVPVAQLKPAQQIFAYTLSAEIALKQNNPRDALQAINHPSFAVLDELPAAQQARSHLTKARVLEANQQLLAAARERLYVQPQLSPSAQGENQDAIWRLVSQLPTSQLKATGDAELDGWLELAMISKTGSAEQQNNQIQAWRQRNPTHPAAARLPEALTQLQELANKPVERVALLLPESGPLSSVARALRDGFVAAHYNSGSNLQISFHDSANLRDLDSFYRQAKNDGVQLVIGPLEKDLVKQLSERPSLPITTLALNYSDSLQQSPAELFQFGLAAEDEAREVARRAWQDGHQTAAALVPRGEWGARVLDAFRQEWTALGGTLLSNERIDQPVDLANQVARLLAVSAPYGRAPQINDATATDTTELAPARAHPAIDFVFVAATPQQAQQIKPTLAFQHAPDLPIYATSHLYSGNISQALIPEYEGIRFCETPWLLQQGNLLRDQAGEAWPQSNGSLGRLYAMGADAYSLSRQLQQLQALPGFSINGLSGQLSLNPSQRIERSLPWAEFSQGQVLNLPDSF